MICALALCKGFMEETKTKALALEEMQIEKSGRQVGSMQNKIIWRKSAAKYET